MTRRKLLSMLGLGAVLSVIPLPALPKQETDKDYYNRMRLLNPKWVSYRFHYTVTLPPNSTYRIRYIDSVKAIA